MEREPVTTAAARHTAVRHRTREAFQQRDGDPFSRGEFVRAQRADGQLTNVPQMRQGGATKARRTVIGEHHFGAATVSGDALASQEPTPLRTPEPMREATAPPADAGRRRGGAQSAPVRITRGEEHRTVPGRQ